MEDSPQYEKWKDRLKKWAFGIDVNTAEEEDFQEFLLTKTYQYSQNKTSDFNLWDLYQDDFGGFTVDHFHTNCQKTDVQELRKVLRCGGVRVPANSKKVVIA